MTMICKYCGESMYQPSASGIHENLSQFEIYCPDQGDDKDDPYQVCAFDHEMAVTQWAEGTDAEGDHLIISEGHAENIMVRQKGEKIWRRFGVTAEAVPEYTAHEVYEEEVV